MFRFSGHHRSVPCRAKETLFGYFVGQVMKATQGKANPAQVNELLKKKLAP